MTLAFFVLIQYRSVTDRQTDIPPLAMPAVCIACYANALVKTFGESLTVTTEPVYRSGIDYTIKQCI